MHEDLSSSPRTPVRKLSRKAGKMACWLRALGAGVQFLVPTVNASQLELQEIIHTHTSNQKCKERRSDETPEAGPTGSLNLTCRRDHCLFPSLSTGFPHGKTLKDAACPQGLSSPELIPQALDGIPRCKEKPLGCGAVGHLQKTRWYPQWRPSTME